jgi:hypothetical protein
MVSQGRYLDNKSRVNRAEVVFWGEWEPPSRVSQRWPKSGALPRVLHSPYWTYRTDKGFRQNTDPWVFGACMIYSNCKQLGPRPHRRPNSLQRLSRGSVICFGSTIDRQFCIDTVFVVADAMPWTPEMAAALDLGDAFKVCTVESLMTGHEDHNLSLTLYRGATASDPVHGMFSFVPARRADVPDPRFPRPAIDLPSLVDPASSRSTRGSRKPLSVDHVRDAWDDVRRQVLAADLMLAVELETPPCEDDGIMQAP